MCLQSLLDDASRCLIIAEAGTAHADPTPAARLPKALALVEAAAEAGADAVKFQWFYDSAHHGIYLNKGWFYDSAHHGIYLNKGDTDMFCWIEGDECRAPRWRASSMPSADWAQVKEFAEACGLVFLASAFQHSTVQWLIDLGLEATKVASRAAKTFPYDLPGLPRPFLISDGMPPFTIPGSVFEDAVLMQCEAKYPSSRPWNGGGGFSDHSGQIFLGLDAISRGCPILEVHFATRAADAGPDLPACLSMDGLKYICKGRDYYHARNP